MVVLNNIYKGPYNVLATPTFLDTQEGSFDDLITDLQSAWDNFNKTGAFSTEVLNQAYKMYENGGSFDYLALFKAGITVVGSVFPEIAPAVPFITMIANFIFPHLFGGTSDNKQTIINIIDDEVNRLLNERLEQDKKDELQGYLNGMGNNIKDFGQKIVDTLFNSNKKPLIPNSHSLHDVYQSYSGFIGNVNTVIDQFRLKSYEKMSLPYYCLAVTLVLNVYRDFIRYGKKWIYTITDETDYTTYENYINTAIKNMNQLTSKATKYVLNTFKTYLPTYNYNSKSQLNTYNSYIRSMTISCLDYVAIWPTLNPIDYPIPTQLDKTRIIFQDIVGPTGKDIHFDLFDIYGKKLPNNDVFRYSYGGFQLSSARFLTSSYHPSDIKHCIFSGFTAENINYKSEVTQQNEYDLQNGSLYADSSWSNTITSPMYLFNMASQNTMYLDYSALYNSDKYFTIAGCYPLNDNSTGKGYHSNVTSTANHKIQAIYAMHNNPDVEQDGRKRGILASLVPFEVTPTNIIGQTDQNENQKIQAFPIEKINHLDYNKIKVERSNGANSISMETGDVYSIYFTNVLHQNYQIRVRAATSSNNIQIKGSIYNEDLNGTYVASFQPSLSNTSILNTENPELNNLIEGINGDIYKLFSSSEETLNLTLSPGNYRLEFSLQTGDTPVILDRVEFIPIPSQIKPQNLNIQDNKSYEIWRDNNNNYASYLSGTVVPIFNPTTDNPIVTFEYFDGEESLGTIPKKYSNVGFDDIPKWLGKKFNRVTVTVSNFTFPPGSGITLANLIIQDIKNKYSQFTTPEDLEKITNQVNQLFTSSSQTELTPTVTDYGIDQMVLKVDALSDDVFGMEKKTLRKLVNQAKQLSKARNVLVGGNFEKGHEWVLGRKATMVANHDLFKGDHLLLPPPTLYPSYAYQKIDESKLQPNTRYTVSGFVAQSEHLEVVVSRYGKEVHDMLDVPYEEALPISSDESPNCCKPAACQCSSCDGSQPDSHFFSYSIDVGSLQSDVNLGIEFGLRIAKPNGFAKISNLEIKEDRPLTEKEIKKVQRKEQKWKKAFDQEQAEVAATLQPTLDQINALYQNEDWNGSLHPHVTYQHLSAVVLPTLPKQRHWFMEDREGEHYSVTQQFQQALDRAFQQIEEQNLIHNGSFA
ncbi:insecticidal delta-endotoxin Cry8Ea1 family protein, partial [Bacillus thuringiensis]